MQLLGFTVASRNHRRPWPALQIAFVPEALTVGLLVTLTELRRTASKQGMNHSLERAMQTRRSSGDSLQSGIVVLALRRISGATADNVSWAAPSITELVRQ